jgi:hypothetical protein
MWQLEWHLGRIFLKVIAKLVHPTVHSPFGLEDGVNKSGLG